MIVVFTPYCAHIVLLDTGLCAWDHTCCCSGRWWVARTLIAKLLGLHGTCGHHQGSNSQLLVSRLVLLASEPSLGPPLRTNILAFLGLIFLRNSVFFPPPKHHCRH